MTASLLRIARVGSVPELVAAVLMLLSYPAMVAAALVPHLGFFVGLCAVSYLADIHLHYHRSYLISRLSKVRAGISLRFLLRQLVLTLLLIRMGMGEDPVTFAAIVAFIVFYCLQAPHGTMVTLLITRRRLPIATRNIDLSELRIADAPPRRLTARAAEKMQHLDLPAVTGVLLAAGLGDGLYGYVGIAATGIFAVLYLLALAARLRPSQLPPRPDAVLQWFDTWLRDYRPSTILYFSGSAASTYQVNMWLETMEQLHGNPLVVLRERHTLTDLAPTSVPVVCVPSAVHLMNMDLTTARVALYPANVGKNIHLLRAPTMKHVFVGHGDSDKIASVNPYSKVYDEVWTAGKAGRDRYALAAVGVRDDDIVEVGRPQLAPIRQGVRDRQERIPTVLYAPTWEGWTDEPGNTSLILAGENIVRRLVQADPAVRVLYKPHPFTGTRSSAARAAHVRIVALLEEAARRRAADPHWAAEARASEPARAAARAELARLDARLLQLTSTADEADDAAQAARDGIADPARRVELAQLRGERNDAYWRSFGWWEHRVITGSRPGLYDCFNESDAMVSDISSVVSDYIASGKPYAVADSAGLGAEEFKRQNTAARAAVVLGNDALELGALLDAAHVPSADVLRSERRELKAYLLGPDTPPSLERFDRAVQALRNKADAHYLERVA